MNKTSLCPLCQSQAPHFLASSKVEYYQCVECSLIFKGRESWPSLDEETKYYDLHENDVHDTAYRDFLNRLANPLIPHLRENDYGLDYGCGPAPALQLLLNEAGFGCDSYDPVFAPKVLREKYDFITCSEVAEHFHDPALEFKKLTDYLKSRGYLAVMTSAPPEREKFLDWYYHRDPTHVVFYGPQTFQWIAEKFGYDVVHTSKNVTILRKL